MRKIPEKSRRVRKVERQARKQERLATLPNYYVQEDNVSASGKVYQLTKISRLVNPGRKAVKPIRIPGILMFEWLRGKLGLK